MPALIETSLMPRRIRFWHEEAQSARIPRPRISESPWPNLSTNPTGHLIGLVVGGFGLIHNVAMSAESPWQSRAINSPDRQPSEIAAQNSASTLAGARGPVWLFSPAVDIAAFLGSAVVSLGLLAVGWSAGWLNQDTPDWTWVSFILLVDVAHVYATGFRVYFVPGEFSRRPWVYGLAPALGFIIGLAVYSESEVYFWRGLAYLAVFHFVRQQYGWVALYRARAGEQGQLGRWIDTIAIYLATVFPLVYWHAHLPRNFWWFLEGDFANLPLTAARVLEPIYWLALSAYFARSLHNGFRHRFWNPGKDIVVATTALCWYLGIVAVNSDYAFTVTNVIIHGVPYLVLVYWYRFVRTADDARDTNGSKLNQTELTKHLDQEVGARQDASSHQNATPNQEDGVKSGRWRRHAQTVVMFLGAVWLLAYAEELLWDRGIWHERSWLFGSQWELGNWRIVLVPLLAVPQLTHYILDGFIWRRRSNPELNAITNVD